LKTSSTDQYWSINIKKGLLSLMQLKLNQMSSQTQSNKYESKRLYPFGHNAVPASKLTNTFSVVEGDINGDCETNYYITTVDGEPNDLSPQTEKIVTKIKNLRSRQEPPCLDRDSYDIGIFAGLFHRSSENFLIQPSMVAEYLVSGDRHRFLIKSAKQEATYYFSPDGSKGNHFSAHVLQKLILTSTGDFRDPMQCENFVTEKKGLKMDVPDASLVSNNKPSISEIDSQQYKDLVDNKLTHLVDEINQNLNEETSASLIELSLLLRQVPKRHLTAIVRAYLTEKPTTDTLLDKKREILLDTLASTPSPDVAEVLIDLISDGSLQGPRAQLSITVMSLVVTPTTDVIKSLLDLYKDKGAMGRQELHLNRTLLLAVGALTNRLTHLMKKKSSPIQEVLSTIEIVLNEFQQLLAKSETDSDKLCIIKAIGNEGSKNLLAPLTSLAENRNESTLIRCQAVRALRKPAKMFSKQVHPILLNLFMNRDEDPKVRVESFTVLLRSEPEPSAIELIAQSLTSEPSRQIKSYVYSSFVSMASMESVVMETMQTIKHVRKVLKVTNPVPIDLFDSRTVLFSHLSEELDRGFAAGARWMRSIKNVLPERIVADLQATVFGSFLDVAQVEFEGSGFWTILRHLVGPHGLLTKIIEKKASVLDLLKPLTHVYLDSMKEKMKMFFHKNSFRKSSEENIETLLSLQLLGQELLYWQMDTGDTKNLLELAGKYGTKLLERLSNGLNVDILKTFALVSNSHIIPTPMGLPLNLNISAAGVLKVKGYLKLDNAPSITEMVVEGMNAWRRKIQLDTDVNISFNAELFGELAVDMAWIKAGTCTKAVVLGGQPIKSHVIIDPDVTKVTARVDMPQKPVKLFRLKVLPMSAMFYIPTSISRLPFNFSLTEIKAEKTHRLNPFERSMSVPGLGVKVMLKGHFDECLLKRCPFSLLTSNQDVSLDVAPTSAATKQFIIKMKLSDKDAQNDTWAALKELAKDDGSNELVLSNTQPSSNRTESRNETDRVLFDPVHPDDSINSPSTLQLHVTVGVQGSSSDQSLFACFTWIRSDNNLDHQISGEIRTGDPNSHIEPSFLKWKTLLRFPFTSNGNSSSLGSSSKDLIMMDAKWHGMQSVRNSATIKLKFIEDTKSQTAEQQKGTVHSDLPQQENSYDCELDVKIDHIDPMLNKYLKTLLRQLQYYSYPYISRTAGSRNSTGISITLRIFPKLCKMDMVCVTPTDSVLLRGAPINMGCLEQSLSTRHRDHSPYSRDLFPLSPVSPLDHVGSVLNGLKATNSTADNLKRNSRSRFSGECIIDQGQLTTFDSSTILLPDCGEGHNSSSDQHSAMKDDHCRILLSQDCTNQNLFLLTKSLCVRHRVVYSLVVPYYHIDVIQDVNRIKSINVTVNGVPLELVHQGNATHLRHIPHNET
jgi:predicted house-cleaning noncanonical NTP pyrophosphatase (MazG superfamily)